MQTNECFVNFGIRDKIVAITVDNAANMGVAADILQVKKIGCFAHTMNLGAQQVYKSNQVAKWAAKIRSIVVWFRRAHMTKPVLKEKQELLGLPVQRLVLDVRTRWNILYLMIKTFLDQFQAIQAAAMDQRLKKGMERDRYVD